MSTVKKIEIPEEVILKQDVAIPLLRYILHFNLKNISINFENQKLTVNISYKNQVNDFNYYVATKYIFKNKNDFDTGFSLVQFQIIDNKIVNDQDKYFIFTWEDSATNLMHSSDYFEQLLQSNEIVSLKVAEEFFSKHDGTNTHSLINQLKNKY